MLDAPLVPVVSSPAAVQTPLTVPPTKPLGGERCALVGVRKSYGTTSILKGVDFDVREGEFAVLVGPSGCGKSTTLRAVAGLESVDAGTVRIGGRDVTALPPQERDIAMVFQSYALYPHLTVRENLGFGLRMRKAPEREIAVRVDEVSKMLGLEPYLDRKPKALSGGQRQRVAMGRALARRAQAYLYDEPLSNLDAALRSSVRVEIRRLHDRIGATSIYVTHDQVEAMTLADRLWVFNGGVVEQSGPPSEVYDRPRSLFVARFVGSPAINLLAGHVVRDGGTVHVEAEGLAVRVAADLPHGHAVVLGVRPQDLRPARDGEPSLGALHVDVVERLGSEALVHGWARASGATIVVRLEGDAMRKAAPADTFAIGIDPAHVHVFDAASGLRLDGR
jgi:sn-glycerol 3-phosphate transport system ATP-binding protein/multiple sugar transport system ATP-binding protein